MVAPWLLYCQQYEKKAFICIIKRNLRYGTISFIIWRKKKKTRAKPHLRPPLIFTTPFTLHSPVLFGCINKHTLYNIHMLFCVLFPPISFHILTTQLWLSVSFFSLHLTLLLYLSTERIIAANQTKNNKQKWRHRKKTTHEAWLICG